MSIFLSVVFFTIGLGLPAFWFGRDFERFRIQLKDNHPNNYKVAKDALFSGLVLGLIIGMWLGIGLACSFMK